MVIRFGCTSCGAPLKLADEQKGTKTKCPKCSAIIEIPQAKRAAGPKSRSDEVQRGATVAQPTSRALPQIQTDSRRGDSVGRYHRRPGARMSRTWAIPVAAAVALVILAAIVTVFFVTREKTGLLILDWPDAERSDAGVDIDGKPMRIPGSGIVQFLLPVGKHWVVMRRPKYDQIEFGLAIRNGEQFRYQPEWKLLMFAPDAEHSQEDAEPGSGRRATTFGSGFVVRSDGYILSNNHVVQGSGQLIVRLPDVERPIPAQIVATDPERDIALLKLQVPEDIQLPAIRISTAKLRRAEETGAFGFPLAEQVGSGVKFTVAHVHAAADQTDSGMVALDSRINPGNSGGPLCNKQGLVVGMITAKSAAGENVESLGMARPGRELQEFLQAHLPDITSSDRPISPEPLVWADVDRLVSPSVVMIINVPN